MFGSYMFGSYMLGGCMGDVCAGCVGWMACWIIVIDLTADK